MDLLPGGPHQSVEPVQSLGPVLQAEQRVSLAVLPAEHGAGPGPHAPLDFLHVVLGSLESALQVADGVAHLQDVLPNAWRETG